VNTNYHGGIPSPLSLSPSSSTEDLLSLERRDTMGHATTYKLPSPLSSSNASEDEEIDPEENGGGEVVMKFDGDQEAAEEEVSVVSDVDFDHKLVVNDEVAKDVPWKANKKTAQNAAREA
jgi:hypothetical protein